VDSLTTFVGLAGAVGALVFALFKKAAPDQAWTMGVASIPTAVFIVMAIAEQIDHRDMFTTERIVHFVLFLIFAVLFLLAFSRFIQSINDQRAAFLVSVAAGIFAVIFSIVVGNIIGEGIGETVGF
jgi:hypothetical protein